MQDELIVAKTKRLPVWLVPKGRSSPPFRPEQLLKHTLNEGELGSESLVGGVTGESVVGAAVRQVEPLHSYSQYLCRLELDTPCYNEFT